MTYSVFIINAAPGAGKSLLLENIQKDIGTNIIKEQTGGAAVIDGDKLSRAIPLALNPNWAKAIQGRMVKSCLNYKNYGYLATVIGFVFSLREDIEDFRKNFEAQGIKTVCIALDCSDEELQKRLDERKNERITKFGQAFEINRKIRLIDADFRIDVTNLTPYEVADRVCDVIKEYYYNNNI